MAKDRDDELNEDLPGGDEFSLESILAEFGGGQKKKKPDEEDTIPFPVVPKSQRPSSPSKKLGRVLTFPDGGQEQTQKEPKAAATRQPPVEKAPCPSRNPHPGSPPKPLLRRTMCWTFRRRPPGRRKAPSPRASTDC